METNVITYKTQCNTKNGMWQLSFKPSFKKKKPPGSTGLMCVAIYLRGRNCHWIQLHSSLLRDLTQAYLFATTTKNCVFYPRKNDLHISFIAICITMLSRTKNARRKIGLIKWLFAFIHDWRGWVWNALILGCCCCCLCYC